MRLMVKIIYSELRRVRALLLESCLLDNTTASLLTSDMLHHLSNERQTEDVMQMQINA
jgi:hypothetical protein